MLRWQWLPQSLLAPWNRIEHGMDRCQDIPSFFIRAPFHRQSLPSGVQGNRLVADVDTLVDLVSVLAWFSGTPGYIILDQT